MIRELCYRGIIMSVPSAQVPLILSHIHTHTQSQIIHKDFWPEGFLCWHHVCLHVSLCDGVICDTIKDTCAEGIKMIIRLQQKTVIIYACIDTLPQKKHNILGTDQEEGSRCKNRR